MSQYETAFHGKLCIIASTVNSTDLDTSSQKGINESIVVVARDNGSPPLISQSKSITFIVIAVNEFQPVFEKTTDRVSVGEDMAVTTDIYQAKANDSDYGTDGDIRYSISAGNEGGYFSINPHTGMVSIAKQLDRETTPYGINLTIEATDLAEVGSRKVSTMTLHVNITDYNDNSPVFLLPIPTGKISEQAVAGTVIEQLQVTDPDLGVNAAIIFSITAGNSLSFFEIEPTTGKVKVKKSLDLETEIHEQGFTYTLTIKARDHGMPSKAATATLIIQIEGVNEFMPVFEETAVNITVAENTPLFTSVYQPRASDEDRGADGDLEYTITDGNTDGFFDINSNDGYVTVTKQLNHLATPYGINLTIKVTDRAPVGSRKNSSMLLKIFVIYTGNTAPVFSEILMDSVVPEDAALDTIIAKVNASDEDSGSDGVLRYSIIAGNSLGLFKIDPISGEIKVNNPLDLESTTHAPNTRNRLIIEARDQGEPPLAVNESLNIQVTGVNEFTPTVVNGNMKKVISENSTVGSVIGNIAASDQDYGEDGRLTYAIKSGNDKGFFSIRESSGKKTQKHNSFLVLKR